MTAADLLTLAACGGIVAEELTPPEKVLLSELARAGRVVKRGRVYVLAAFVNAGSR